MPKRTARSIAEKKAQSNSLKAGKSSKGRGPDKKPRQINENSLANLAPYRYPKGTSGNPGGKPGTDIAAKIARTIFQNNEEAIYYGMGRGLLDGSAYDFSVLADRAFGKVKDVHEVSVTPLDVTIRFIKPTLKDMK